MNRSLLCMLIIAAAILPVRAQTVMIPLTQRFDSVQPPALPPGWGSTQNRSAGTNDFTTTASSAGSAPNAAISTNATILQALTSPLVTCGNMVADRLAFSVRRSASHNARLITEASADSGRSYPFGVGDTLLATGSTGYVRSSFSIDARLAVGPALRFRWRILPDASGTSGTLRIDDIVVSARPAVDADICNPLCDPPFPREGETCTVSVTVANRGALAIPSLTAQFFLDTDNDALPDPHESLGSFPLSLSSGDSARVTCPVCAPARDSATVIAALDIRDDGDPSNNTCIVSIPIACPPGSIAVNEIMYAPDSPEPEWVELVNTRDRQVSLSGWSMSDAVTSQHHSLEHDPVLAPGALALLTSDSALLAASYGTIPCQIISVSSFPSLNNGGDAVVIFDRGGRNIDSVLYLPAWGGSTGRSLERLDPVGSSTAQANWQSAGGDERATPGRPNSVLVLPVDLAVTHATALPVAAGLQVTVEVTVKNCGKKPAAWAQISLYYDGDANGVFADGERVDCAGAGPVLVSGDSATVRLAWRTPVPGMARLGIVLDGPSDERPANNSCRLDLAVPFPRSTLVINEIMFAPRAGEAEYFELFNHGSYGVDVHGWQAADLPTPGGTVNQFSLADTTLIVPAGGFLVMASDSSILRLFPGFMQGGEARLSTAGSSSLGLNNDGDAVVVRDRSGSVVDSVAFQPGWHNPSLSDCTGRSLEKIRPGGGSNDARGWSSCVQANGGTPGRTNSVYAPSLPVSSRLACFPNPFSPDGDGLDDFTAVHYELPGEVFTMSVTIFDVKGRPVRHLARNEPAGASGDIIWGGQDDDNARARVGMYVVFLEAVDQQRGSVVTSRGIVVLAQRL